MPTKTKRPVAYITRRRDDDDPRRVGKLGRPYYIYTAWDGTRQGADELAQYRTEALEELNDNDPYAIDSGLSVLGALMESQGFRIITNLQGATIDRTLRRFKRAATHNQEVEKAHAL